MTFLKKHCNTIHRILVRAGYIQTYCIELPDGKHEVGYSKTCAGITIKHYRLIFSSKNRCIKAEET